MDQYMPLWQKLTEERAALDVRIQRREQRFRIKMLLLSLWMLFCLAVVVFNLNRLWD